MAAEPISFPSSTEPREPKLSPNSQDSPPSKADITVLLWLILFGFGGGMLSMYYANIGYFPEIQWQDSLVYLGAMTIVGVFFFLFYSLLLFLPGWMWSELLISDDHLYQFFHYGRDHGSVCVRTTLLYFGLPFLSFMGYAHWVLIERYVHFVILPGLALLVISAAMGIALKQLLETKVRPCSRQVFRYAFLFSLSLTLSFCSLLFVHWSSVKEPNGPMPWVCTVVVTLSSLFVAVLFKPHRREAVLIAILASLCLLILGDQLVTKRDAKLSARVMSSFGIGYGRSSTILLENSAEGRRILDAFEVPYHEKGGTLKVDQVEILSRLGAEYFVSVTVPKGKRSFPLAKRLVISWAIDEKKNK